VNELPCPGKNSLFGTCRDADQAAIGDYKSKQNAAKPEALAV